LSGPKTRFIDAGGRLVTPGLIEAHVHLGVELLPLAVPNLPIPTRPVSKLWPRWNRRRRRAPTGSLAMSVRWSHAISATGARRWTTWHRAAPCSSRLVGTQHRQQRRAAQTWDYRKHNRSAGRLVGP
jgi:predicted amidohydrolase YtcJ